MMKFSPSITRVSAVYEYIQDEGIPTSFIRHDDGLGEERKGGKKVGIPGIMITEQSSTPDVTAGVKNTRKQQ